MGETTHSTSSQPASQPTYIPIDALSGNETTIIGDGNVVGDHNVVTITKYLAQSVRRLPTGYATRIENFLVECLGTPDQPVPFGGREADLARLDDWLDDADASPYLMLAAPAGRGKSALLARWSQRLLQRDGKDAPNVVFIPVSARFRTNLASVVFTALAVRLAHVHGDEVPLQMGGTEMWRGMVSDYLSRPLPDGRPLLVILDGVDEVADWELEPDLFPLLPPEGLRVVVSARYRAGDTDAIGWLRRLGWDRPGLARALGLAPLSTEGVADVLVRQASDELITLANDNEFVNELARVSEGDPLTVRVIVDALRAGEITPESLSRRPPGLDAYLEEWMQQLEEQADSEAAWRLLGLCAVALGPLTSNDLAALAPEVFTSSRHIRGAVRAVERFILGDGTPENGYVFSHPRLREYFESQLLSSERRAYQEDFVSYGQRVFDELPDKSCPAYVRQFWGRHLAEARKWENLHKVVATGDSGKQLWAETHYSASGSYAGYLLDLSLAWEHADEVSDGSMIGRQVRYALIKSSIHSLARSIPASLLSALVEQGLWSAQTGLDYALQITDLNRRREALVELMPLLPQSLEKKAKTEIEDIIKGGNSFLVDVKQHWSEVPKPAGRDEWESLGPSWHWSEREWRDSKRELKVARAKETASDRAMALLKLAVKLPKGDRRSVLREAWKAAQAIKRTDARTTMLKKIGGCLPESDRRLKLEKALEIARAMTFADIRAKTLAYLEHHLPETNQCTALKQALLKTRAKKDATDQARVQARSEPYVLKNDQLRFVLEVAQAIGGDKAGQTIALAALAALVPCLAKLEYQEEAVEIARTLPRISSVGNLRAEALTGLMPYLAETKRASVLEEELEAVWLIEDGDDRAQALTSLTRYLPKPLKKGALTGEEIDDGEFEDWVLHLKHSWQPDLYDQAPSLSQDDVDEVRHALSRGKVKSTFIVRDLGLVPVGLDLAKQGYPELALATVREIENKRERVGALVDLHLPEPFRQQALEEAYAVAEQIEHWNDLSEALVILELYLSRDRLYSLWRKALHMLARLPRKYLLTDIRALAPLIFRLGGKAAINETFQAIQDVGRWWP